MSGAVVLSILVGSASASAAGEPSIVAARTGDTGDGHIDTVRMTFSDAMTATAPTSAWFAGSAEDPGFRVSGYEITAAGWEPAGQATATTLRLDLRPLAAFDTGATPRVHYQPIAGGPKSSVTGLSLGATPTAGTTSLDDAGPVLSGVKALDLPAVNVFNVVGERLSLTFSEPVLLAGVGAVRGTNLENAIKFTGINEGFNGCPSDGTATANQNFPQAGTGTAPITPTSPGEASTSLSVTMRTNNVASVERFIAVPKGCKIGIDPSNNSVLTDAAGNAASHQNLPTTNATQVRIEPADIALTSAKMLDGIVGSPDGRADAISLVFDQNLDDATLSALASQLGVSVGGVVADGWTVSSGVANDNLVRILGSFGSGVTRVTVARAACTHAVDGTTTSGAKGPVVLGAPYAACVGTAAVDALDGVAPTIVSAITADLDADGRQDAVHVQFTETLASGSATGWALDGVNATTFTLSSDTSLATIAFPPAALDAPPTPALQYVSQGATGTKDAAGNEVLATSVVTTNGLLPRFQSALIEDLDADGRADRVRVRANRNLVLSNSTGFTYGGIAPTGATVDGRDVLLTFGTPQDGSPAAVVFDGTGVADTESRPLPAATIPAGQVTDQVAPVVRTATTRDADADDLYDAVEVTFAEPVTVTAAGWALEGIAATGAANAPDGRSATLTFPEVEGATRTPTLAYADPATGGTKDVAGNASPSRSYVTINGLGPSILSATTKDTNQNGLTDQVFLQTSVPVTFSGTPGFTYDGVPVAPSVAADGITLTVAESTGGAPRAVAFDGTGVTDAEDVSMRSRNIAAGAVIDAVAPFGTIVVTPSSPIPAGPVTVVVTFTEPMTDALLNVTMDARSVTPTIAPGYSVYGWRADDARVWEGSITISESDCSQSLGCPVTFNATDGKDLREVAQAVAAQLAATVDTAPPAPALISNSSARGGSAPSGYINAASTQLVVNVAVPAGEADGGRAEILIDGGSMNEPLTADIPNGASSVTLETTYADVDTFRAALGGEGNHELSVELCDAATNCVISGAFQLTVDITTVPVTVTEPTTDALISGGDTVHIAWDTDSSENATSVLAWSGDGSSWTTIASDLPSAGTFDWTTPAIEKRSVQVRVKTSDAARNFEESIAPATLTVDSSAPVVTGVSLPAFARRGAELQVRWIANDASIDRVENPIQIQETVDGGATWRAINGGSYDRSNDGVEGFTVPNQVGAAQVRVIATDAGGRSTIRRSRDILTGVEGVVVDKYGTVAGYGATEGVTPKLFKSAYARDVALRSDGLSGYVLSASGSLTGFALPGGELPPQVKGLKLKGIASQLLLLTDSSGYVVDAYGRMHRFGGAPSVQTSERWMKKNLTRDAVLLPGGKGGYVLDRYGRAHPFRIGNARFPREIIRKGVTSKAAALILRPNGRSGWVVDARGGRLIPFGGAPRVANPEQGQGAAVSAFRVTASAGYWLDSAGRFHPWGGMTGDPRNQSFAAGTVLNAS